jgi:5-bromo-4-chloroindolyl phosphate hydrolysis protein
MAKRPDNLDAMIKPLVERLMPFGEQLPLRSQLPLVGPLLLYLLPLPLFPAAFIALARGDFVNFTTAVAALALLMGAAVVTRRGLKREVEVKRLGWSRIAARPWKVLGAAAAGLATGLCSFFILDHSGMAAGAWGVTTLAGVLLRYRPDNIAFGVHGKLLASRDKAVTQALEEARLKIASIDQANRSIHNQELNRRIRRIINKAMAILTTIADDPAMLQRSRKFLKVYLDGAQQVTEGYAQLHPEDRPGQLEDNFRNVLVTIEDTFAEQQRKLLEKDLMDLDVKIEVLTTQLKNEGVI